MQDFVDGLAEDGRILDSHVHPAGLGTAVLPGFHLGAFLGRIDLEKALAQDQDQDDADDTERVSHGIAGSQFGSGLGGLHRVHPAGRGHFDIGLLGGTEARSVGHRTGHDAHHRLEVHARKLGNAPRHDDREKHVHEG